METAVAFIPLLPLLGFIVVGLAGRRLGRRLTAAIACSGPIAAAVIAIAAFNHVRQHGPIHVNIYEWIASDDLRVPLAFVLDELAAVMCLVVTCVGSLIHVYSAEYMGHERRGSYARYFSYLNLFMAMMLVLVLASSLPLLFVGWEGVGLCSYLLIGFWYGDHANADAGKKAFIVNRIGDFGFLLGIFLLFATVKSVDIADLNTLAARGDMKPATLTAAALLLFVGACGKSAQIPLYVWLPDAMAGPTPVSALIHAATMVTAGVYMVARMHGVFLGSDVALAVVAGIGIATAFFAATMALPERDLKKVLAYSTVSQLGYMFVGVGTGTFTAGIFHLVTHAFFKALLFLGAGSVMHAIGTMDMEKMGGLRRKMPITATFFVIGALALAGIPPFAGFFSKDEILAAALNNFVERGGAGWIIVWVLGVVTAGMTAFYTFRAVTLTFFGEPRGPVDAHAHAHEPGLRMLVPLALLALASVVGGLLNVPPLFAFGLELLGHFLEPALGHPPAPAHAGPAWLPWIGVAIPTLLAIVGAAAAGFLYSRPKNPIDELVAKPAIQPIYEAAVNKYWVDWLYERSFVEPIKTGAAALWEWVDVALIDNGVNGLANAGAAASRAIRRIQAGPVGQYAFYLAGGAVVVLLFVLGWLRVPGV